MTDPTFQDLPAPAVHRHRRHHPSVIWIVPFVAIVAALTLGIRAYLRIGPAITVTFETADGLEAGKSEVRFKNVPIGKVDRIALAEDRRHIIATLKLTKDAAGLAARDTQFWVERPRIGVGGVTGLSTIVSGAYIGVNAGASNETIESFVGLEHPPGVTTDQRGRRFKLTAREAGSLALHTPIYLHQVAVGWISALELAPDGKRVTAEVFVEHPYEDTVTASTVFWNASGMDVTIDAGGLRIDTQSLATVVAGGLAYGVRDANAPDKVAAAGTTFALYDDRPQAMMRPDVERIPTRMRFPASMRGVAVGAGIDFQGVTIGAVDSLHPGYDATTKAFYTDVDATVFPERLEGAFASLVAEGGASGKTGLDMLQSLVGRGLRAQIRSGNLITGAGYIALAWLPHDKATASVAVADTWTIPTVPGGVDHMQEQVQEIITKIDAIPFDAIGKEVQQTIASVHQSTSAMHDNLFAPDSPIQSSLKTTLEQVQRAAFSLRGLADFLQQHPESLIRGKK